MLANYKNRLCQISFMTLWVLLIPAIGAQADADNSKVQELQRKIADIGLIKQQLEDRREQAETLLAALAVQKKELVTELRLLHKSLNIRSYKKIKNNKRVKYNIKLLQTIDAYNRELSKKIRMYHSGYNKLSYLLESAEDDIQMINTLHDFEVDALTTQISLVINKYLSEAHIIQIDPEKIKLSSPETIWNRAIKGQL